MLDIGAGGGHYSIFLNRTGLVTSFAVDAAGGKDGGEMLASFTGSRVQFFDAQEPVGESLLAHRVFDTILCLEVAEHIRPERTNVFVQNLEKLGRNLVISWAPRESCGLGWGHVNCRSEDEVIKIMEQHSSFRINWDITARFRARSEVEWIARTILYFSKHAQPQHSEPSQQHSAPTPLLFSGSANIPAHPRTSGNVFGQKISGNSIFAHNIPNTDSRDWRNEQDFGTKDFGDYFGPEKTRVYGRNQNEEFQKSLDEAKLLLHTVVKGMYIPERFK